LSAEEGPEASDRPFAPPCSPALSSASMSSSLSETLGSLHYFRADSERYPEHGLYRRAQHAHHRLLCYPQLYQPTCSLKMCPQRPPAPRTCEIGAYPARSTIRPDHRLASRNFHHALTVKNAIRHRSQRPESVSIVPAIVCRADVQSALETCQGE
jgi:hypothetical protein